MDAVQLAERIDQAIDLNADDIETLEHFVTLLPEEWQHEVPKDELRWFRVHRSGIAANFAPAILIFCTKVGYYSVAILDASLYQETHDYEVFEFKTISEVISEVRDLQCEFMQTEDPSWLTPLSWASCANGDDSTGADCSRNNSMSEGCGCLRKGSDAESGVLVQGAVG